MPRGRIRFGKLFPQELEFQNLIRICLNCSVSFKNFGKHDVNMNLYYLDQRFQSGSIIKVLEIPFHSGSVVIFQNFFAVLFLNRMNSFGILLFESP
nr:hypothetical protein CFP56_65020 [Quercus suber]